MPFAKIAYGFVNAVSPVEDDEALNLEPLRQHASEISRPGRRRGGVVGRYEPAERNTPERVHQWEDGVEDLATDVFEVNVDPLRALSFQVGGEIPGLVVDSGVEAEF